MEKTKFDLLVKAEDGTLKRVSFDEGKQLNPIGIFPKAANFYLELAETDLLRRHEVNSEKQLPTDEELRVMIGADINLLNENLRELNKPIIRGRYAVKDDTLVAVFRPHAYLKTEAIGNEPVTARYCGRL